MQSVIVWFVVHDPSLWAICRQIVPCNPCPLQHSTCKAFSCKHTTHMHNCRQWFALRFSGRRVPVSVFAFYYHRPLPSWPDVVKNEKLPAGAAACVMLSFCEEWSVWHRCRTLVVYVSLYCRTSAACCGFRLEPAALPPVQLSVRVGCTRVGMCWCCYYRLCILRTVVAQHIHVFASRFQGE